MIIGLAPRRALVCFFFRGERGASLFVRARPGEGRGAEVKRINICYIIITIILPSIA